MPEKELNQGIIEAYIHPNKKIGTLVEIRCETDFVAKTEEFKKLAHELCLQIAAMDPLFLKKEDIPEKFLAREKKLKKYKEEISLMSQRWIRDETKTVKDLIDEHITKIGENIVIKRFERYEI